jgi:hypothetical protein
MCKALLLQNFDVFPVFHVEKPTALLLFTNVNEQRTKRKTMKKLKKNIMTSKPIIDMELTKNESIGWN